MIGERVQCAIAGGGPAGVMLGYLLARAGVQVVVLEKHADFFRDFRGDTVHPSTLEVMFELGILEKLLERPHQEVRELAGEIGRFNVKIADFTHLPTRCKFIALMPQWDFLDFLAGEAQRFQTFRLLRNAAVTELLWADGARGKNVTGKAGRAGKAGNASAHVVGVRANTPDGPVEIEADLVVGADGRTSVVRERGGLVVQDIGAPIDVLWMRMSRKPTDPDQTFGHIEAGAILVMLDRGDYWQCGFVIPKAAFDTIRTQGIDAFRARVAAMEPFLQDRVDELRSWDDVKLLTVKIDRLREWCRPGLLCIGDAAHAMSPVGGVGINLAIQDAVAAANLLSVPLRKGSCSLADLRRVQRRRELPTRLVQAAQVVIQRNVIFPTLGRIGPMTVPWPVKLLDRYAFLRRIPARLIGIGFRPEHVHDRMW